MYVNILIDLFVSYNMCTDISYNMKSLVSNLEFFTKDFIIRLTVFRYNFLQVLWSVKYVVSSECLFEEMSLVVSIIILICCGLVSSVTSTRAIEDEL